MFRVVSTGALKSNGLVFARACRLGRRVSELRRLFEYMVEAERPVQNTQDNSNRLLSCLWSPRLSTSERLHKLRQPHLI